MKANSCIVSPATTGSLMPAALFRVATDNSTASAVKPKAGGSTDVHASATRNNARTAAACQTS